MEVVDKKVGRSKKVSKTFPIKPLFSKVIITLNKIEADGEIVLSDNVLSENQYVVAKGSAVREVEVGDNVIIDIEKLMVTVANNSNDNFEQYKQIKLDLIQIDGVDYAIIEDRYIKAIDLR